MTSFVAFLLLFATAVVLALWLGGGPERTVAVMFVLAWLVSVAVATWSPEGPLRHHVQYQTLAIDTLLLVALLAVARRANRTWPVVVASLELLIVLAHVARALNPHQSPFVYAVMTTAWAFAQLIVLIVGTILYRRRLAAAGPQPGWKR